MEYALLCSIIRRTSKSSCTYIQIKPHSHRQMFFCIPIVCGTHNFDGQYDNNPKHSGLYCPHCHNNSVAPIKRREFFTIWFIPLVPLHWGKQLRCNICGWRQDFRNDAQLQQMLQPAPPVAGGPPASEKQSAMAAGGPTAQAPSVPPPAYS